MPTPRTPVEFTETGRAGNARRVGNQVILAGGNSSMADAFSRLRVSEPVTLFDSQLQYDLQPLIWETVTATGGTVTHQPSQSSALLATTAAVGSSVIRQSRAYVRYQPGKSQLVLMTGNLGQPVTGVRKRIGYFDDANGLFFQLLGSILSVVKRSGTSGGPVETVANQGEWNIDRMDGNGISGIDLDHTQAQIFLIDLEWLGTGRVRFGFVIGGQIYYCHEVLNSNRTDTVYMTTANLPLRCEITNVNGAAAASMRQICSQVASEGGFQDELGIPLSASNGATTISVTTRRPVLSIRPRLTFNGIVNRARIDPARFWAFSEDQPVYAELVYGGVLTNASFANVDTTHSVIERDVAATAITGGVTIAAIPIPASSIGINESPSSNIITVLSRLPLALDTAGAHPTTPLTDNLSVVVTSIPGTATDISGGIDWKEIR